ncbi:MAG: DNA alkylation repair protein [Candidatus Rifleibacteriota bacterium]
MKKQQLNEYLKEVQQGLASLPGIKTGNHYNSPTPTLGLTVPQSRAMLKRGYSFLKLDRLSILQVLDHIWNHAVYFEEMCQAVYFYEKKSLILQEFTTIADWIERCDNWAHSDCLSSIYARALEENPKLVWPVLKSWNSSPNPWKRRQSVVSMLYYSRLRKSWPPFKQMIEMVKSLLNDEDYYVQKGVGWAIREIHNLFPVETFGFIKANVKNIRPAAWQASTEKLKQSVKTELMSLRKAHEG